ncbi:MAG TPA: transposase [Methanofastidiosum sp.]|nr:transposase [Methanofastidiosum sp.]
MPGKGDAINEKYVNMGKFCISFDFLNTIWDEELALMNKDKVGRPYLYPESFIRFVATIRTAYGLRYRQTEGFLQAISEHSPKIRPADYTIIWRRTAAKRFDMAQKEVMMKFLLYDQLQQLV